jgi:tetratricopeptide (TPR) repeat protein
MASVYSPQATNGDLHMVQLNFVKAQAYYQKALQLLPPSDREHRGQYLNSLGNSLREAGIRTKGADIQKFLREAVTAYRDALTVRTQEQLPQQWGITQNNLGLVLWDQATRTGGEVGIELFRQAINAFELALQIRTRDALPVQWEKTMMNLKIAKKALEDMK